MGAAPFEKAEKAAWLWIRCKSACFRAPLCSGETHSALMPTWGRKKGPNCEGCLVLGRIPAHSPAASALARPSSILMHNVLDSFVAKCSTEAKLGHRYE